MAPGYHPGYAHLQCVRKRDACGTGEVEQGAEGQGPKEEAAAVKTGQSGEAPREAGI